MEFAITLVFGILLGILIKYFIDKNSFIADTPEEPEIDKEKITELPAFVFETATELDDFFSKTSHPKDLLNNYEFNDTVNNLVKSDISNDALIAYANGENLLVSCIVLEALLVKLLIL